MSKINDITLARELESVLVELLKIIPDDVIKTFGDAMPGGFRDPKSIRDRLKGMIHGPGALPQWLIARIQNFLPVCGAVEVLSIEALRATTPTLAALAGAPEFLLALLIDPRSETQKLAAENMRNSALVSGSEEKEAARDSWTDLLNRRFLRFAGLGLGQRSATLDKAPVYHVNTTEWEALVKSAKEQEKTIANLRDALQRESKERSEEKRKVLAQAKVQQGHLNQRIASLTKQIDEMAAHNKTLEQQIADAKAAQEKAVEAGVRTELDSLERKWLGGAVEMESLLAQTSTGDLLERVESALEAQAQRDRQSGNRRQLQQRLDALRAAEQKLLAARQNALHTVPGLALVAEEVTREIEHLAKKLGVIPCADGVFDRLLQHINESPDFTALHECAALVEALPVRSLFPSGPVAAPARGPATAAWRAGHPSQTCGWRAAHPLAFLGRLAGAQPRVSAVARRTQCPIRP